MRIALAQIDPLVGDIAGNRDRILDYLERARAAGAELVVFPELAVFGYPPRDLVHRRDLVRRNVEAVDTIARRCTDLTAVVGYIQPTDQPEGKGHFNAAAVCREGRVIATYAKMLLPEYDVFDERRYFDPGHAPCVVPIPRPGAGEIRLGITVCEDLWNNQQFEGRKVYGVDPIKLAVSAGAELLVNLSASPYRANIQSGREALFARQIHALNVPLVYVNQVGGNDELLFDGASLVLRADGSIAARTKPFTEDLLIADLSRLDDARIEPYPDRVPGIREALLMGLRDYLYKCGFESVVIGLSGGIDSALAAALAVDALGPDRVLGVSMPSRYTSRESIEDAAGLASNLGIRLTTIPIDAVHRTMEEAVADEFRRAKTSSTVAEENIQARIRGNVLMALSNKFGLLLLTTGNKSELAVGYCTLYGDMSGGLALLSDVPKTVVYALCRHINECAGSDRIPQRVLDKSPSAELKEDQRDQDTLPPYDTLDPILEAYIEREMTIDEIAARGFDRELVERVAMMVDRSEYKRKQIPIGLKVTGRAFGMGRRMPIAARFR